jgi:transcriptional regulator with XRE-family HTH domain
MSQVAIPVEVSIVEIARERSLGGAIGLCAKAAGFSPKEIAGKITVEGRALDAAQWSRWESGSEGVIWPKFEALMDACGNDAPLLWMLHARGYDLSSLRKTESETERKLRLATERIAQLERDQRVLANAIAGRLV